MQGAKDFVSPGTADQYQFKLGKHIASSLSGFIAGAIAASLIWLAVIYIIKLFG